jgi:cytoskeletal protein CcmA (bactofilin family)
MLGRKGGDRGADRAATARTAAGEGSMSLIGPGMSLVGDLVTEGTVRVEGRIEGTVRAGKTVIVSKDGEIVGNIITQDAVIGGRVRGTLIVESRLELQATSDIEGQISAPSQHLKLEEGARFNGQIEMVSETPVAAIPARTGGENSTEG